MKDDDFELPDTVVEAVLRSDPSHRDSGGSQARGRALLPRSQTYEKPYNVPHMRRGGFLAGAEEIYAGPSATMKAAPERISSRIRYLLILSNT